MTIATPCDVSVVRGMSRKPCLYNASFGCDGAYGMWIGPGCRGRFRCQGHNVTCGSAGIILKGDPPRHYCSCAPLFTDGIYGKSQTANPKPMLPEKLRTPSVLVQAKLGQPRFFPQGWEATLTAVFSMWNVLDALMAVAMPEYAWQTGYVRELQLRRMIELVQDPSVSTYCEVGFNGGHSAAAMLLANPKLTVHAFDLLMWKYSNTSSALLRTTFGRRFRMHPGDSADTIPAWFRDHLRSCDMLFIDGDHTTEGALLDMVHMRDAARPGAYVIADDINSSPGTALEILRALGQLRIEESYGPFGAPSEFNPCMRAGPNRSPVCSPWGFAVFRYAQGAAQVEELTVAKTGVHAKSRRWVHAVQQARKHAGDPGFLR
eukprot:CAMPEP_0115870768 /NCGR_PEP_ID=MMETSP0287-20121206/22508_1 /TAXON_ID=412157 /ORGANISM="Chrysochromulina rotalis, Strain UIO044" /LENGTH=374 /DNA_ID=CAMNT_0003325523 /DNA_START=107 /DNA_END=1231 /DNA_ORIENTATION=-